MKILIYYWACVNTSREIATQPVILWIALDGKPTRRPVNFGYHDVLCTDHITVQWNDENITPSSLVIQWMILILGKCKALWGKPRTLLRLSQRSTELSCTRFDAERSKKSKAIDEQRCGTFFLREHISPRTSSTVVRVQVVGVCEVHTLAGMLGLVIVLDPACACQ